MNLPQKLPFLNNGVAQVAIIVPDLEKAVETYWKLFGIGPWHIYTYGQPLVKTMTYHGELAEYKMRVALSYLGPTRIELIQPLEGENVYDDFVKEHGYGVHHFGVLVDDMQAALIQAEAAGLTMIMDGAGFGTDGDGHYAYLDTEDKIGVTIELIERPAGRANPETVYPYEEDFGNQMKEHALKIRSAHVRDSVGLAQVQVDSYRTAYAGILPQAYLDHFTYEEQTQDWYDLLVSGMDDVLVVAESEAGEIIGYALGSPASDVPHYDAELSSLHVRAAYQGQGIGQQLVVEIATRLHANGCTSLMVWTLAENPARSLYERWGGQWIAERPWGGNKAFGVDVKEVAYGWPNIEDLLYEADR